MFGWILLQVYPFNDPKSHFRAESEADFGTVSCLGYNKIGGQDKPCSFSIKPAGMI
jgi:hypothetical protein